MATRKASHSIDREMATPVLELYQGHISTVTAIGASAEPLPNVAGACTMAKGRSAMLIQNLDTAKTVYVDSHPPDIYACPHSYLKSSGLWGLVRKGVATQYSLKWLPSGSGTAEYYAVLASTSGDPSISDPSSGAVYGIVSSGGAEAALTNGTVGSLSANNWDYGDNDTLGYNTIYIRIAAGNPGTLPYFMLMGYKKVPDTSSNYGYKLGPGDAIYLPIDGTTRMFAAASAASANVLTWELF